MNGTETEKRHLLVSSYASINDEKLVKLMNKFSSKVLPTNVKICIAYSETKLSSQFKIKE